MSLRALTVTVFKSIIIVSFLGAAGALVFTVSPTSISPESQLEVKWTPGGNDPSSVLLLSIECDKLEDRNPLVPQASVTRVTRSFPFNIPNIFPQFQPPLHCHLIANSTDTNHPGSLESASTATFTVTNGPRITSTFGGARPSSNHTPTSAPHSSSNNSKDVPPPAARTSSTAETLKPTTTSKTSRSISTEPSSTTSTPNTRNAITTSFPSPGTSNPSSDRTQVESSISTTNSTLDTPVPSSVAGSTNISTSTSDAALAKQPIAAIVGGVLGGLFGLAVVAAIVFFCRRKRQNSSDLDLLWTMRTTNMSPSPSLKEEWSARVDAAMDEAARQTERARSRAGSTPQQSNDGHHDTSRAGWQSPDTMGDMDWYGSPARAISPALPPLAPDIHHGEYLRSLDYAEPGAEIETGEAIESADTFSQDVGSSVSSVRTSTSRSLRTKEEQFELERTRQREEIFERMRRVLDNSFDDFDPYADDIRR